MIIATAGHVDHGKTALVHALTGVDTDRLAEEKRRGLTIDLGYAYQSLPDGISLGFVDVPGHQKFARTMLAGMAGIDFALLVVAADDGPMPQTIEHLAILNLLGMTSGACVITKCDKVPAHQVQAVSEGVSNIVAETSLAGIPIFPVASLEGQGIAEVQSYLASMARGHARPPADGPPRFIVDRAFSIRGSGLVVTGTLVSGRVAIGDHLALAPGGDLARVRGLHAQNETTNEGVAGERLGINIAGNNINVDTVSRGDWLVAPDRIQVSHRLDAEVEILTSEKNPFGSRGNLHVHIGAADIPARFQVLGETMVRPGHRGLVHLVLQSPVSAVHGDRVILRDKSASRTLGGGRVIDPMAPKRQISSVARLAQLRAMAHDNIEDALAGQLNGGDGLIEVARLMRAWNVYEEDIEKLSQALNAKLIGPVDARALISDEQWDNLCRSLVQAVDAYHVAHTSVVGIGLPELHRCVGYGLTAPQFRSIIKAVEDLGILKRIGGHITSPGFQVSLSDEEAALWQRLIPLLATQDAAPPRVVELVDSLSEPTETIIRTLTSATRLNLLHPVAKNRFFLASSLRILAQVATKLGDNFTAGAFRDATGLGRNVTIEVLEYFDLLGFTHRDGNARIITGDGDRIFHDPKTDPIVPTVDDMDTSMIAD
jgi:selenocysteine-specific elongation factor